MTVCRLFISTVTREFLTSYVWVHHAGLPDQATAYDAVRDEYFRYWDRALKTFHVPYFPNITMGWDPSPRCDQRDTLDNSGYPFTHKPQA